MKKILSTLMFLACVYSVSAVDYTWTGFASSDMNNTNNYVLTSDGVTIPGVLPGTNDLVNMDWINPEVQAYAGAGTCVASVNVNDGGGIFGGTFFGSVVVSSVGFGRISDGTFYGSVTVNNGNDTMMWGGGVLGGVFYGTIIVADAGGVWGGVIYGPVIVSGQGGLSGTRIAGGSFVNVMSLIQYDSPEMRPFNKWQHGINGSSILGMQ
jgi:hypothetical protein